MSVSSAWICATCHRQLRTSLTSRTSRYQRGLASLSEAVQRDETTQPSTQPSGISTDHNQAKRPRRAAKIRKYYAGAQHRNGLTNGRPPLVRRHVAKGGTPLVGTDKQGDTSGLLDIGESTEDFLSRVFQFSGREVPPVTLRYSQKKVANPQDQPPAPADRPSPDDAVEDMKVLPPESSTYRKVVLASTRNSRRRQFERGLSILAEKLDIDQPLARESWEAQEDFENEVAPGFRWNSRLDTHPLFPAAKKSSRLVSIMRSRVKSKNIGRSEHAWRDYELSLVDGKGPTDRDVLFGDLTRFLHWAVTGNLASDALKIWQTLQQYKFDLGLRHWTMMLKLAGLQRDLTSVLAVWDSIRNLKEKADNRTWSVLLGSLCRCSEVRWTDIKAACDEMQRQWRWLATSDGRSFLDGVTPVFSKSLYGPSVIPYNSGLAELLRSSRWIDSQKLLDRMAQEEVKPSINTFNIMMQPPSRAGNIDVIRGLMVEIKQHNLKPDRVTFTQVLDGMIRRLSFTSDHKDVAQVTADIKAFFKDMQSANIVPAHHTYATALAALLLRPEPILGAARTVLRHMDHNKVQPNMFIFTILVKYYTRPVEPQIAAAEAIHRRVQDKHIIVDHRFYDAMIQGYAACSEVDKMLRMLRHIPRTGHKLSWSTMSAALDVLMDKRELSVAVELVEDLETGKGMGRLGCYGPREADLFWGKVESLRRQGILPPSTVDDSDRRDMTISEDEQYEAQIKQESRGNLTAEQGFPVDEVSPEEVPHAPKPQNETAPWADVLLPPVHDTAEEQRAS